MDVAIRRWEDFDSAEGLTELLHRAYARWGEKGIFFVAVDQTVATTIGRLADSFTFVAVEDDRLAGVITLYDGPRKYSPAYYGRDGVWFFGQFAVEPSLQGTGLGWRLMQAAEKFALEQGGTEIACDTRDGAVELVEYYERCGYRQVETHGGPFTSDRSIVLAKRLSGEPD